LQRPRLRAAALAVLDRAPLLRRLLRKAARGSDWQAPQRAYIPRSPDDLSPDIQAAYCALQEAIARQAS
jgi:hypothetical protein